MWSGDKDKEKGKGFVIGIHGKIGSGKNETAKQIRKVFKNGDLYQERAFADSLKQINSALTRSDIKTQYSDEGKNSLVVVSINGEIKLDTEEATRVCLELNVVKGLEKYVLKQIIENIILCVKNSFPNNSGIVLTTIGILLQAIGKGFRENINEFVWVNHCLRDVSPGTALLITDVRSPNEKKCIKDLGGKMVKVVGDPKGVRARSNRDLNDISETALDNDVDWDFIINNEEDNIDNLISQVKELEKCLLNQEIDN